MSKRSLNTYQSITLWYCAEDPNYSTALVYTVVENVHLKLHLRTSYEQGKKELARLALRLCKMPEVTQHDNFTCYSLHGFLD